VEDFDGTPIILVTESPGQGGTAVLKRTFDFTLASIGIVILSPVLLLLAIVVKADSPGPRSTRRSAWGSAEDDSRCTSSAPCAPTRKPAARQNGAGRRIPSHAHRLDLRRLIARRAAAIVETCSWGTMSLVGPGPSGRSS